VTNYLQQQTRPDGAKPGLTSAFIAYSLLMLLFAAASIYRLAPPAAVPASAPVSQFSSARAINLLEPIARKPHPLGSPEHAAVRDYLLKEIEAAGLSPEVQKTTAVNQDLAGPLRAGTVENIVARLKGTGGVRAILIVGHYDSVSTSLGASDDGVAVVMMLETMRALSASPQPVNDVIFLFSDGEEVGLLGAKAFVDEHPWAKDVGVVLNFEARGTSGPSLMFETSSENGWLIKEFARASSHPIANSLAYEIYRLLPNDTDLTVFKRAGYTGYNFAYINGASHYHTLRDDILEANERSLQHHGTYALDMIRHLGSLDLANTREANSVYFDLLGFVLIHYSVAWVLPLAALIALGFVCVLILGQRVKRLKISAIGLGAAGFLLMMLVSAGAAILVGKLVAGLGGGASPANLLEGLTGGLVLVGFVVLTFAIAFTFNLLLRQRLGETNLRMGALLVWLAFMLATALLLPGASYVFAWPLLFALIGLVMLLASREDQRSSFKIAAAISVFTLPAILLLAPIIYQAFIALGLSMIAPVIAFAALLIGTLTPHLAVVSVRRKWLLPTISSTAGVSFIVAGSLLSSGGASAPRLDQVFYGLNADTGKAIWATFDRRADEWTSQFFSCGAQYGPIGEFIASSSAAQALKSGAPALPLAAPSIAVINNSESDGIRTLHMRITSPRQANAIAVYLDSKAEVISAMVNGRQTESRAPATIGRRYRWSVQYSALPTEGVELMMQIKTTAPISLRVVDQSLGLPSMPGSSFTERPPHLIPAPGGLTDSTLVSKSFSF